MAVWRSCVHLGDDWLKWTNLLKNKIPQSLAGLVFYWSRWSESNRRPAHYE